jgi:hypothetical protein
VIRDIGLGKNQVGLGMSGLGCVCIANLGGGCLCVCVCVCVYQASHITYLQKNYERWMLDTQLPYIFLFLRRFSQKILALFSIKMWRLDEGGGGERG